MDIHTLWFIWAIATAIGLYCFLMQRSALEISRACQVDANQGRIVLLPLWCSGTAFMLQFVKLGLVVWMFIEGGWVHGVSALILPMILATVAPVPHAWFRNTFKKRISNEMSDPRAYVAIQLRLQCHF